MDYMDYSSLLSVISNSLQPYGCMDYMDYSSPGSSVHGILQAIILEWVAIPSPGDLPDPGIEPRSPALQADSLLLICPTIVLCFSLEGSSAVKASACSAGGPGLIPGLERSPGEGMATHSSILAWRIPWT